MTAGAIPISAADEVDDMLGTVNHKIVELKAFALVLYMAASYESYGLDNEQRLAFEIILGRVHSVALEAAELGVKAQAAVHRTLA